MADDTTAAAGPLDAVYACPGCGCLVVDQGVHSGVCHAHANATTTGFREQLTEWLDMIDPDEIEKAAFADATLDTSPTVAILDALKKAAAG